MPSQYAVPNKRVTVDGKIWKVFDTYAVFSAETIEKHPKDFKLLNITEKLETEA